MKRASWILAVGVLMAVQPAWAARTAVHEAAESPQYGRKFGGMIGRGVLNAATCFVDVIVNTVNDTKAGPPLVGTLTGVAKGVGCGVLRLGSGAVDLVTFWVPGFNGFPVSDSYDNCFAGAAETPEMLAPASSHHESQWEVPTTEPGAAPMPSSAPTEAPVKPKRVWKK